MEAFALTTFKLSPEQRKMARKFDSAKSAAEMIKALKDLERCFLEKDLVFSFWNVALKLCEEEKVDAEKVLYFAKKALPAMIRYDSNNIARRTIVALCIVSNLQLLGSVCIQLNRFDESSKFFSWVVRLLEKFERNTVYAKKDSTVWLVNLSQLHRQLYSLKRKMRKDCGECMSHLLKNLEIIEKIYGKHSKELAEATYEVATFYCAELKFREGLPFCMKSFEIYTACAGDNSLGIAKCSQLLGVMFTIEGDHEKALEHNLFSKRQWMKSGVSSASLPEIKIANSLSQLGRHEEAVQALRDIIPRTDKLDTNRVVALIHMAEAYVKQEKLEDAKKCSKIACGILEKKKKKTHDDVFGFIGIATVYEEMNEFGTAISLLQKTMLVIEEQEKLPGPMFKPLLQHVSAKLLILLLKTGKVEEAIPYLEVDIQSKEKEFGSKSFEVGDAYSDLKTAYLATNKLQLATEAYASARDILDECLGSHHMDSIKICKSLSWAYEAMGSYSLAISVLEEVIRRLKIVGSSVQDDLDEALRKMAEFVEKASVPVTNNTSPLTKSEDTMGGSDVIA